MHQVYSALTFGDIAGGLLKAEVFATQIARVGCFRGFQTSIGADSIGRQTTAAEEIVRLKLAMVGLGGYGSYYPAQLSGGMKKRAGLARALPLDPNILFCYEPTGASIRSHPPKSITCSWNLTMFSASRWLSSRTICPPS